MDGLISPSPAQTETESSMTLAMAKPATAIARNRRFSSDLPGSSPVSGWKGLAGGVLEAAVTRLGPGRITAWLGPAIGPGRFEVGPEVRERFLAFSHELDRYFALSPQRPGHFLADIYALARFRLQEAGVEAIYGGGWCTVSDPQRFYSYRRDGQTGRMASCIWLEP